MAVNPYKALDSYKNNQEDISYFKGRSEETRKLVRLIERSILTLVYGPSGVGKTSLINAGVAPHLPSKFTLLHFKLDYNGSIKQLVQQTYSLLERKKVDIYFENENKFYKISDVSFDFLVEYITQLYDFNIDWDSITLWEFFNRVHLITKSSRNKKVENFLDGNKLIIPVLVFDQFEELVTIGRYKDFSKALKSEIVNLVENFIPDKLSKKLSDSFEELSFSYEEQRYRIVLSLREDYLPHILSEFSLLTFKKHAEIRISFFNKDQAREVIELSPTLKIEIGKKIIAFFNPREVSNRSFENEITVEPSIISLLCYQFHSKYSKKGAEKSQDDLLEIDKDDILRKFYNDAFTAFGEKERMEIKKFVEDRLLTPEGFRIPYYIEQGDPLRSKLEILEQKRLIRTTFYSGKPFFEIIHDILIPIIKASKEERIKEEDIEKAKKEQRNKNLLTITILSIIALVLTTILGIIAWNQRNENKRANSALRLYGAAQNLINIDPKEALFMMNKAYQSYSFPEVEAHMYKIVSEYPIYQNIYKGKTGIYFSIPLSDKGFLICEGSTILKIDTSGRITSPAFLGHKDKVVCASISPDGKRLISSDERGKLILWDFINGNIIDSLDLGFESQFLPVLFVSDSLYLTSIKNNNNFYIILKNAEGKTIKTFSSHKDDITSLSMIDKNRFISTSLDRTACIWNLINPADKNILNVETRVSASAISPDKNIAVCTYGKEVKIWDSKGNLIETIVGSKSPIVSITYSPDGRHIIGNLVNGRNIIWRMDGSEVCKLVGHRSEVVKSYFSSTGNIIYTFSDDSTVRKWDVSSYLNEVYTAADRVACAKFSPNDNKILSCFNDSVVVWNRDDNSKLSIKANQGEVWWVDWSKDGERIVSAGEDGTTKIWTKNLTPDTTLWPHVLKNHTAPLLFAEFVKNDSAIISTSKDSTVQYTELNKKTIAFRGHEHNVYMAFLIPKTKSILTCSRDNTAKIWDLNGNVTLNIPFKDRVRACATSPNGKYIALAVFGENAIYLYDIQKKKFFQKFLGHKSWVLSVRFSPDGEKLISGEADSKAILWDLNSSVKQTFTFHSGHVTYCEFSPDGKFILTSSNDYSISTWKLLPDLKYYLN